MIDYQLSERFIKNMTAISTVEEFKIKLQNRMSELEKVWVEIQKKRDSFDAESKRLTEELLRYQGEYRGLKEILEGDGKQGNGNSGPKSTDDKGTGRG